jgi:hypothetical protein
VPLPNWSQQVYYKRFGSPSSMYVLGYRTPNGD